MVPAPYRIGVLHDMVASREEDTDTIEPIMRLAIEEVAASGRLDRDVEFVDAYGLGLPSGTAAAVERAFRELVAAEVLMIVGPAIGDDALVATPLAERCGMPTINFAGSERARGEFMFHLQVGSHEDESLVLARHLASMGARRVGVVHDRSPIGHRHFAFFRDEADLLDIRIVSVATVSPVAEAASSEVSDVLDAGPDAVVYLGLGLVIPAIAGAVRDQGFEGPRLLNAAGMRGYHPAFGRALEGWTYPDMHSDRNRTLQGLRSRLGELDRPGAAPAYAYDLGRLVAEGLARAPERTRGGVKAGLEEVKWLRAAEGHEGTLLGFGHCDRAALHGEYLVLRQWLDGRSVEVGTG